MCLGVSFVPRRRGDPPTPVLQYGAGVTVTGPILLLLDSGEVCCTSQLCPPLHLLVPSPAFGIMIFFFSLLPVCLFAANPLASGKQYYLSVCLAHHLSGSAVRLKIFA